MDSCYVLGLLLGVFLAINIQTGEAIKCYVCNSHASYEGGDCSDPFDETKKSKIGLTDCSAGIEFGWYTIINGNITERENPLGSHNRTRKEPVLGRTYDLCRKQHQIVEGEIRVTRSCGTKNIIDDTPPEDYVLKCTERTGSHNIKVNYCESEGCEEGAAGNQCNGATAIGIHTMLLTVISALTAFVFLS